MPVLPGAALTATVQQMEKAGFEGVFVLQIYGPPFVPLAAASTVTETLKLGTGIAIAGTRSPLETAYAAMDLDRIRSEERRVGKECVSTCRSRWSPYH